MSYCPNPNCKHPKNPNEAETCKNCGDNLFLRSRYQILNVLGKGGFGTTFAARDLTLPEDSLCVIKQLRPMSSDNGVLEMAKTLFHREAKILGHVLEHPQVPKLLDSFEEQQRFYLVQQYIKGNNLHREVRLNGTFSEEGVKQFLSEILPIMEYLHKKRIVHRDIKPANIIRRQDDRQLVLIDFGAVKNDLNSVLINSLDDGHAFTAFAVGTAGFAPPEQLARRPVYASDIYALGVTCIYLLTGKTPKTLDTDPLTGQINWQKAVSVSQEFAEVLEKMMKISVRERYRSTEEVLDALDMAPYMESLKHGVTTRGNYGGLKTNPQKESKRPRLTINRVPAFPGFSKQKKNSTNKPLPGFKSDPRDILDPVDSSFLNEGIDANKEEPEKVDLIAENGQNTQTRGKKATHKPKLSKRELLNSYREGIRDFAEQVLTGVNLVKANLSGINLYQANLARGDLQGIDFTKANLGHICLQKTILKDANLSGAYLVYADLEKADLRGADLSGANLKHANLSETNLCGANLLGAQIKENQLAAAKTNWRTILPSGKRNLF